LEETSNSEDSEEEEFELTDNEEEGNGWRPDGYGKFLLR
jgi:hypothetical protein